MISYLVTVGESTSSGLCGLPTVHYSFPKNRALLSEVNYRKTWTSFYDPRKTKDDDAITFTVELKYCPPLYAKFVNYERGSTTVHWFTFHVPLLLAIKALILLILDSLWLTYPPTKSIIVFHPAGR